ncbi:MAG: TolB family protein, partial [bacterium]
MKIGLMLGVLISFLIVTPVFSQRVNPYLNWQVLETPHFLIIFSKGNENIGEESANIAEDVYTKLSKFIKPSSSEKTAIVLLDNSDFTNGFTDPLDKSINIWLANPQDRDMGSKFESWLRLVITHEYMHILHMDQVTGVSEIFRNLFGRIVIPNSILPYWMIEGYAVYAETHYAGGGRGNDTIFDMYLREMFRNNKVLEPDQVGGYDTVKDWPEGTAVYLYGASVFDYIAQKYGEDKLAKISDLTSSYLPILMGPDLAIKEVLGIDYRKLWNDWKVYLKDKYDKEIAEITKEGVTPSERLTKWGYNTSGCVFSPDGGKIVYTFSNPYYLPGLRILDLYNKKDIFLNKGVTFGAPSFSPDGKSIIYAKGDYSDPFMLCTDLYRYNLVNNEEEQLTRGVRAFDPVFLSNNEILFLKRGTETIDIARMNLITKDIETFISFPQEIQVKRISISPDKKFLAASIWKEGFQDIYLIDIDNKQQIQITSDVATDSDPVFSPDGRFLIFSSDRSGIFNLYAYDITKGGFFKITNLIGGAFEPSVSENKIAFIGYDINGYDVYLMDYKLEDWKEEKIEKFQFPKIKEEVKTNYPVKDYRAIDYLLPKYWVPLPFGFTTSAQDYLGLHSYSIIAAYDALTGIPFFSLNYVGSFMTPQLVLNINYDGAQDRENIYLSLPLFTSIFNIQNLDLGIKHIGGTYNYYGLFGQWDYGDIIGDDNLVITRELSLYGEIGTSANWSPISTIGLWQELWNKTGKDQPSLGFQMAAGVSNISNYFHLGGDTGIFSIHGYDVGVKSGATILSGSVWIENPIIEIYRGIGLNPIFFKTITGKLYLETGIAGDNIQNEN